MIVVDKWRAPTRDDPNSPFPSVIAEDPWTVYHGTCNFYEDTIDAEGLRPNTSLFTKAQLEAVVSVFDALRWAGRTTASLGVLRAYSLNHDFGQERGKPIFFHGSAQRSSLFAGRDFAGGEVARALRYSFDDLMAYLESDDLREEHREYLERKRVDLQMRGAIAPPDVHADLDRLAQSIASLEELRRLAHRPAEEYRHGVVYAVRIPRDFVSEIEASPPSMGIKVFAPIPVDWIMGKALVPATYDHDDFPSAAPWDLPIQHGLMEAIREMGAVKRG